MVMFSLLVELCLPIFLFRIFAECDNQFYGTGKEYSVCRFTRNNDAVCDFKKFDSGGDEPCMIGRKAGLTRIDGVKVWILSYDNLILFHFFENGYQAATSLKNFYNLCISKPNVSKVVPGSKLITYTCTFTYRD